VLDVIDDLAGTGRADGVLVCPQGFVSDHLEVVYDLDLEARRRADERGLVFGRTRVLNDDPTVLGALADRVREAAPG
jgi:ferrochelatase